jgi:hypothetical protein
MAANLVRVPQLSGVRPQHKFLHTSVETTTKHSECVVSLLVLISLLITTIPVLIIGCGSYQPIDTYATNSSSSYPIYTDHAILDFNSNLATEKAGEEKRDYMRDMGSTVTRYWVGLKGALGSLQHTAYVGPKSLNGGELVISAGK